MINHTIWSLKPQSLNGLNFHVPLITRVKTHLLSWMSHQVGDCTTQYIGDFNNPRRGQYHEVSLYREGDDCKRIWIGIDYWYNYR